MIGAIGRTFVMDYIGSFTDKEIELLNKNQLKEEYYINKHGKTYLTKKKVNRWNINNDLF